MIARLHLVPAHDGFFALPFIRVSRQVGLTTAVSGRLLFIVRFVSGGLFTKALLCHRDGGKNDAAYACAAANPAGASRLHSLHPERRVAELGSLGRIEHRSHTPGLTVMKITRKKILAVVLLGVIAGALVLQFIAKPICVTWLRAHSTVWMVQSPPGGRHSVAVYRYPKLRHVPEYLGFGQGYVQLYDKDTGRVLQEKVTDDLAAIRLFAWGPRSVTISGFVEWDVPGWFQAQAAK